MGAGNGMGSVRPPSQDSAAKDPGSLTTATGSTSKSRRRESPRRPAPRPGRRSPRWRPAPTSKSLMESTATGSPSTAPSRSAHWPIRERATPHRLQLALGADRDGVRSCGAGLIIKDRTTQPRRSPGEGEVHDGDPLPVEVSDGDPSTPKSTANIIYSLKAGNHGDRLHAEVHDGDRLPVHQQHYGHHR